MSWESSSLSKPAEIPVARTCSVVEERKSGNPGLVEDFLDAAVIIPYFSN